MIDPEISVIIVSYNSKKFICDCLKSLEKQITSRSYELLLIDSSTDGTNDLVSKTFPHVKVFHFSERKFPGDARNIGISIAKGKIIAFIDADCRAEGNWIEMIAKAHKTPHPVCGGAIANANPESYVGWAAYFTEFSHWMPGTPPKWLDDIPAANLTYKREIFDKYGSYREGTYCSDTDFHWRIGKERCRLRFEPFLLVAHHNIDKLRPFLSHEFYHGRDFGRVRIQGQKFSPLKRVIYMACGPFIALKIFSKVALDNMNNRTYLPHFIASLPLLVLGIVCWSMGEVVGYAGGYTARAATPTSAGII